MRSTTGTLGKVFSGGQSWDHAVAHGEIEVAGPPRLVKALPRWFLWSPFADTTRERGRRVAV